MAVEYIGNNIPAPGFYKGNVSTDDELLDSTARFTQKGVTLAPGQGAIPLGTVVSRRADKKWIVAASGAVGYPLRTGVNTGTDVNGKVFLGNIVVSGILKLDRVKNADVAAYVNTMNARSDTNRNILVL